MKILVTLIVALAAVLCLLLFVDARMKPIVVESAVPIGNGAPSYKAPPATDIEITVPLPENDRAPHHDE